MSTTNEVLARRGALAAFNDWMLKRGILFLLISTPMISLFPGFFLKWTNFAAATAYTVIIAFAVLPAWVIYRKSRSTDPDEPVHHLHKYALWALAPYVVYNLARIPMHYALGIVFWDHWYDYGSELTGVPVDQWGSLIPGTLLHSLQGYVLGLGFYILYKRHSLLNALCYVWLFLSTMYTWTFPTYVLVDFRPPPQWFFVVWWAHFWMALAAWYLPKTLFSRNLWDRLRSPAAKTSAALVIIALYITPVTFVFIRAETWQFPFQREIDTNSFNAVRLVQQGEPRLIGQSPIDGTSSKLAAGDGTQANNNTQANYEFALRFGPRPYKDYIKATKALDAGPIIIRGALMRNGEVVAWCFAHVAELETPNNIIDPKVYFPTLERMTFTDIPVSCSGPASASAGSSPGDLKASWAATVTLVGDRETEERHFDNGQEG